MSKDETPGHVTWTPEPGPSPYLAQVASQIHTVLLSILFNRLQRWRYSEWIREARVRRIQVWTRALLAIGRHVGVGWPRIQSVRRPILKQELPRRSGLFGCLQSLTDLKGSKTSA